MMTLTRSRSTAAVRYARRRAQAAATRPPEVRPHIAAPAIPPISTWAWGDAR